MSEAAETTDPTEQETDDPQVITPEDLIEWVEYFISGLESVDSSIGQRWCSQWWNHTEAVARFRALYERWLNAQADGEMSSWWVDHFDRHAAVLFAKHGPFGECGTGHQEKGERRILACEAPPTDWTWSGP